MRAGDIQKLTSTWYELLSDYRVRNQEIAGMCLKIIGLYIGNLFIFIILLLFFISLSYYFLKEAIFNKLH